MKKPWIFISYRRTDSPCWAGRIYDRLLSLYDRDSVYRDTESISVGQKFPEHILEAIKKSQIVLVVIGPQWSGEGKVGQRQIDNENDWVRKEIEAALRERELRECKQIFPILVDRTTMPVNLPESIEKLASFNSTAVRDKDFAGDMRVLIDQIDQELKQPPSFKMALWKPFQEGGVIIDFPRVALRDSWFINSEEVRLLVGSLGFLNADVAQPIEAIAEMGQIRRYANNHLVILGSPGVNLSEGRYPIDRRLQSEMAIELGKILGNGFELYRRAGVRSSGDFYSEAVIRVPNREDPVTEVRTEERGGKVDRDCGLVVRMKNPYNHEKKVLWAFGFTAPGTFASMAADTQHLLCDLFEGKDDDFLALFDVQMTYGPENQGQGYARKVNIKHSRWLDSSPAA